jgi:hypothetical protein
MNLTLIKITKNRKVVGMKIHKIVGLLGIFFSTYAWCYTYHFKNKTSDRLEIHAKLHSCDQTLVGWVEPNGELELYAHGDANVLGIPVSRKGCLLEHLWAQDSTGYAVADYGYPNLGGNHTFDIDKSKDDPNHPYQFFKK